MATKLKRTCMHPIDISQKSVFLFHADFTGKHSISRVNIVFHAHFTGSSRYFTLGVFLRAWYACSFFQLSSQLLGFQAKSSRQILYKALFQNVLGSYFLEPVPNLVQASFSERAFGFDLGTPARSSRKSKYILPGLTQVWPSHAGASARPI